MSNDPIKKAFSPNTIPYSTPQYIEDVAKDLLYNRKLEEKKGLEVVQRLIIDIVNHPVFEEWCRFSRLDHVSERTQRGIDEIEALLSIMRISFVRTVSDMTPAKFESVIQHFVQQGIQMEDICNLTPDSYSHYVQIKLDNGTGNLFVYNSATQLGR